MLRIYANGLWFLPLIVIAAALASRRRLKPAEVFFVCVSLAVFLSFLLVNEITPILAERRMRYTLVMALPLSLALAIASSRLPAWPRLAMPLLALWIGSCLLFADSQDLEIYTNRRSLDQHILPHFQDFIYEADSLPSHQELILSFHPQATNKSKLFLKYYRARLDEPADIAHMTVDAAGQPQIESAYSSFASPAAIIEHSKGIWLVHNPSQSTEADLERHFGWLPAAYRFCKRYLDKPRNIVDYYLQREIPCQLVTAEQPLAIRYSSGAQLANLVHEQSADKLRIFLRWSQAGEAVDSFSLQIFSDDGRKVGQLDQVISRDPIDIASFDLAELDAGEYAVKLIVYAFATGESRSGLVQATNQAIERELDVLRFSMPN